MIHRRVDEAQRTLPPVARWASMDVSDAHSFDPERLDQETKLQLLQKLLNNLHETGTVSRRTLIAVATDVMLLDYQNDEDLLCFNCLDGEIHDT